MISDTLDDTLKQMLQYYRDLYRIEPGIHLTELPTLDIDQTYQQIIDWMPKKRKRRLNRCMKTY